MEYLEDLENNVRSQGKLKAYSLHGPQVIILLSKRIGKQYFLEFFLFLFFCYLSLTNLPQVNIKHFAIGYI